MSLGKYFNELQKIYKTQGINKTIDWAAEHADPAIRWSFNESRHVPILPSQGQYNGIFQGIQRGVRTSIGNTALYLKTIRDNGLGNTLIKQIKSDLHREVDLGGPNQIIKKNGKEYLKSRSWIGLGDREVLGKTGRNSVIVRKRKILTPVSLAFGLNAPAMAAAGYWGSPSPTVSGKLKDAAIEGTLFGLNPAVGTAYLALT